MLKRSYNTILDEHLHILIAQGNHEAFEKLKKRYYYHSLKLCRDILSQYDKTGITSNELVAVCNGCFLFVVKKYDPQQSSFYSFWKQITSHYVMEYLSINSYNADAASFRGSISIDEELDDNHPFADMLCERDDDKHRRKLIIDIKRLLKKHSYNFTKLENGLLNLILEGYSIADLEHSGVMSRSKLYLTFNSAIEKLQRIVDNSRNRH